jgi:hypothetical protein
MGSSTRNSVRLEITNWAEIMRELGKLDKTWVAELKKDFRRIAKEPQKAVQNAIPSRSRAPLSGMKQVHFGRLAWGTTYSGGGPKPKPAKSVLVQLPGRKSSYRKLNSYPIVRLQVGSPATVLADMAGAVNGIKGRRGLTPEYDYMYTINGQKIPGRRRHRVKPFNFIQAISNKGKGLQRRQSSRFVWPAVEKAMPKAVAEMDRVITNVNIKISARLARNV